MNNNCVECQRVEEEYRENHPTPTGGQMVSPLDLLCATHRQEAIDSGKFSPMQVPAPKN
ncbi:MAG: hypothetical protein JWN12_341 [Candidatus Saccharibacteria bacterium]|nr:hypothetical protein [Candidatus Saccharibacteria bacterium]